MNSRVSHHEEYITTSIHTDSVKPIPFNQEFGYTDVISVKADDYSKTSWTDYDILDQDSILSIQESFSNEESQKILARKYPAYSNKRVRFFTIAKHFSFEYGLEYLPLHSNGGVYQIIYQDYKGNSLNKEQSITPFKYTLIFSSKLAYTFNKKWGLFYASNSSLNSHLSISDFDFGVQYVSPIFNNSRKWLVNIGAAFFYAKYNHKLGNVSKTGDDIILKNKQFDASRIDVLLGKNLSGIKPSLSIYYKVGKFMHIFLKASSSFKLSCTDLVTFRERTGFFPLRKKQSIQTNDSHFLLSIDNIPEKKSKLSLQPYQLGIGLAFRF